MDTTIERSHPRWIDMWNAGISPGQSFDKEGPSPALIDLIESGEIVSSGRCLVPGCGRGYDVAALTSSTRFAVGMDLSEKAVESANEWLQSQNLPEGMFEMKCGNFFDIDTTLPENQFDFVYDYTFLCALDPSIRPDWANKMAALVKPGGELCTLIYPIQPAKEGGPPFKVSLELMSELLLPVGFTCKRLEVLPPSLSHEGRDGTGMWEAFSGIGRWIRE